MIANSITIYFGLLFLQEETSNGTKFLSLGIILIATVWFWIGWIYCIYATAVPS